MRSHPSCWNKTLAQLGFRRKRRKASKAQDIYKRRSLFEMLEQRQMLSGDPLLDLAADEIIVSAATAEQPVQLIANKPIFVLIQPEIPEDELLSLPEHEHDKVEPVFVVETVETAGGPKAIISLNPNNAVGPPAALQRLILELHQNNRVVQSYSILIDIAEEEFREQFLADRIDEIEVESEATNLRDAKQPLTRPATAEEIAQQIEFWDTFIGPKSLEQEQSMLSMLDGTSQVLIGTTDVSAEDLVSIAKGRSRSVQDLLVKVDDKEELYSEVEKQTEKLKQDRQAATTDAERESVAEQEKSLKKLALVLAKDLRKDLKSTDNELAQSAQKVRDELIAISDPEDLLFVGLGVDNEVHRKTNSQGDEKALSFIETGRYVFDESLEIDLGEHPAMVQVTKSSNLRTAQATSVSGSPAVEDGTIDEANPATNGGAATVLHVDGTSGSQQESLIRFDLNEIGDFSDPTTIASAALQLTESAAGTGDAEIYVWNGLLDGPAGGVTDWDETNASWNHIDGTLDLESKLNEFTKLSDWTAGTTTEIDVTNEVQRALLYGDANGDGVFGAAGMDGDIEAFHLAVTNWDAYVAEYGPRANSANDLLNRTDSGLGDGAIDTADIADFFRRHGYSQGDYNLDGTVQDNEDQGLDGQDWATWQANYGLTNARFTQGDGNFDGVVNDDDYDIWFDRKNEDNVVAEEPEIIVWVRPEDSTTAIEFAAQEHATLDGPTLVVTKQPDLALNKFSVDGSDLVVGYSVIGETFVDVQVQLFKAGSPDTLLYETNVLSGALGSHDILIPTTVLSSILEGDSIYAKVIGTPAVGTQANLLNDQLDFEFSTASTQTINSLDDAGVDTLLRGKHTLRELLTANDSLGWFDTLNFGESLFGTEQSTITLGDHTGDGVADRIDVNQDLLIMGPGPRALVIDARDQTQGIVIGTAAVVTLSGLGVTQGYSIGHGAGIYNKGDLTLDRVAITESNAQSHGGAIYNLLGATLDINSSTLDGNNANYGGGISAFLDIGPSLSIDKSTISNNTGSSHSGGMSIVGSNGATPVEVLIVNSTFSGNEAGTSGGAIRTQTNTELTIVHSTITDNTATNSAGGVWSYPGLVNIVHNSILAGNHLNGSAVWATDASGNYGGTIAEPSTGNVVGIAHSGLYFDGNLNQLGTSSAPLNPLLTSLDTFGGLTATHALRKNSPAVDRGDEAMVVTTLGQALLVDQRGFPSEVDLPGIANSTSEVADAGAFEYQEEYLAASSSTPLPTISLMVDKFDDIHEDGRMTLRDALNLAAEFTESVIIQFDLSQFTAGPRTIVLQDQPISKFTQIQDDDIPDPLWIESNVTIEGPGADQLIIDANGVLGFHNRDDKAELRGLAITDGSTGVYNLSGDIILDSVVSSDHSNWGLSNYSGTADVIASSVTGNARQGIFNTGTLHVVDSEIRENGSSGTAAAGGGIYNYAGEVTIERSTIAENQAQRGGGVATYNGINGGSFSLAIIDSTISGNQATSGAGGGIHAQGYYGSFAFNYGGLPNSTTVTNSTVSGNSASAEGGGVYAIGHPIAFTNTTITKNSADDGAGIYAKSHNNPYSGIYGSLESHNTIIAGNKLHSLVDNDVDGDLSFSSVSSHNLIGAPNTSNSANGLTHDPSGTGNIVGDGSEGTRNPLLSDLGNFGGPTETHALLLGSPAINSADDGIATTAGLTQDQRGFARDDGFGVDIGASEYHTAIWREAENYEEGTLTNPGGATLLRSQLEVIGDPSASKGRIVSIFPGQQANPSILDLNPGDYASDYSLSVQDAGTYKLWARLIVPDANADRLQLTLNSNALPNWEAASYNSQWQWLTLGDYAFNAGANTLRVGHLNKSVQIDKFFLTSDTTFVPSGFGGDDPALVSQGFIELPATIRDFNAWTWSPPAGSIMEPHPDFEGVPTGSSPRQNLTDPTLNENNKPTINSSNPPPPTKITPPSGTLLEDPNEFNFWFTDDSRLNRSIETKLQLVQDSKDGSLYHFIGSNTSGVIAKTHEFYPIDGLLLSDPDVEDYEVPPDTDDPNKPMGPGDNDAGDRQYDGITDFHNAYFTLELNAEFTYREDLSEFQFLELVKSDDDLWVFIDGKLWLDNGGVHVPYGDTWDLAQFAAANGLEHGKTYSFDLFHAQRRKFDAHLAFQTNIELRPVGTDIRLAEGTNLVAEHTYETFDITPDSINSFQAIEIDYSQLAFDGGEVADPLDANDTFELALLDAFGRPVVPTIGDSRDAFFSIAETPSGQTSTHLAGGIVHDEDETTVTLDVSSLVQTAAASNTTLDNLRIVARLVNNDHDEQTSVLLNPTIEFVGSPVAFDTPARLGLNSGTVTSQIDADDLDDVTAAFNIEYTHTSYDEDRGELRIGYSLTNTSTPVADVMVRDAVYVVVENLRWQDSDDPISVTPAESQGTTATGSRYYDVSHQAFSTDGESVGSGDEISGGEFVFLAPEKGKRFDFDFRVLGHLNDDPYFTNSPIYSDAASRITDVAAGEVFEHTVKGEDPDQDAVKFRLISDYGSNLTWDNAIAGDPAVSEDGELSFTQQNPGVFSYPIEIEVFDAFGGASRQDFIVQFTSGNEAPYFIEPGPGLDAYAERQYTFTPSAIDPDQHYPLTYALGTATDPHLLSLQSQIFDADTGAINWTPDYEDVGETYTVEMLVYDSQILVGATPLSFEITVHPGDARQIGEVDLTVENVSLGGDPNQPTAVFNQQTLTVAGTVTADIHVAGTGEVLGPFDVSFFEDRDFNQMYDPAVDVLLGSTTVEQTIQGGHDPEDALTVAAVLDGKVQYAGAIIWAFVDSGNDIVEAFGEGAEGNNYAGSHENCGVNLPIDLQIEQIIGSEYPNDPFPGYHEVQVPPIVADINLDGIPEVIFMSFGDQQEESYLRVMRGDTGEMLFTYSDPRLDGVFTPAVGNIDDDPELEIVAWFNPGSSFLNPGIIAINHDGSDVTPWVANANYAQFNFSFFDGGLYDQTVSASIVNLDQMGPPEIIVGDVVLNNDGSLRWTGYDQNIDGATNDSFGNGFNKSIAADIDRDGSLELLAGNTLYSDSGVRLWSHDFYPLSNETQDGFTAIGNLDSDADAEVVFVSLEEEVFLLDFTRDVPGGEFTHTVLASLDLSGIEGEGWGPPTLGDVDNDGELEIGIAGSDKYVMVDYTSSDNSMSVKWTADIDDSTSFTNSSTLFDYDVDGELDVVYRDQVALRIFQGGSGSLLNSIAMGSGTLTEYPVIADVDNDGEAEILVPAADYYHTGPEPNPGIAGVVVLGDANNNWGPARKIWNQYSYHITNVNDDGSIPLIQEPSWLTPDDIPPGTGTNTFRVNEFSSEGGSGGTAPDLIPSYLRTQELASHFAYTVRVGNSGSASASSNALVQFYDGNPTLNGTLIAETTTINALDIGRFEDVSVEVSNQEFTNLGIDPNDVDLWVVVDPDDQIDDMLYGVNGAILECRENNNLYRLADGIVIPEPNNPPVLADIDNQTRFADQFTPETPFTLTASATDQDPGHSPVFDFLQRPKGMEIDGLTGEIAWFPTEAQSEQRYHSVTVRARDGHGGQDTERFTIEIKPPNVAPVLIHETQLPNAVKDEFYEVRFLAYDPYDATSEESYLSLDDPAKWNIGTPALPVGLTFTQPDPGEFYATISGIPIVLGDNQSVVLSVEDSEGAVETRTFNLNVVTDPVPNNQPPEILSAPRTKVQVFQELVWGIDVEDPENNRVEIPLSSISGTMIVDEVPQVFDVISLEDAETAVANNPGNPDINIGKIIYDDANRVVYWTPGEDAFFADQPIQFAVDLIETTAAGSNNHLHTFDVYVSGSAQPSGLPEIIERVVPRATVGEDYFVDFDAIDPERDFFRWQLLDAGDPRMSLDPRTGKFWWKPTEKHLGRNAVEVAALDSTGQQSVIGVEIFVRSNNVVAGLTQLPPILEDLATSPYSTEVGETLQIEVSAKHQGEQEGPLFFELTDAPETMFVRRLSDTTAEIVWKATADDLAAGPSFTGIQIDVTNQYGESAANTVTFDVTVLPDATDPVVSLVPSQQRAFPGMPVGFFISVFENHALCDVRLVANHRTNNTIPEAAIPVNPNFGAVHAFPVHGIYDLTVTVIDEFGLADSVTIEFEVLDPNVFVQPVPQITGVFDQASEVPILPFGVVEQTVKVDYVVDNSGVSSEPENVDYIFELLNSDGRVVKELARGRGQVSAGTVSINPTTIPNGSYILRLTAINETLVPEYAYGNIYFDTGTNKLGNFAVTFTDLETPVAGIPVAVTRTYDSTRAEDRGDFGYGWTSELSTGSIDVQTSTNDDAGHSGFDAPLFNGSRITITLPGGETQHFTTMVIPQNPDDVPGGRFGGAVGSAGIFAIGFRPDPGQLTRLDLVGGKSHYYPEDYQDVLPEELVFEPFGSADVTVDSSNNIRHVSSSPDLGIPFNPATPGGLVPRGARLDYRLTLPDYTTYTFNSKTGELLKAELANGNRLEFDNRNGREKVRAFAPGQDDPIASLEVVRKNGLITEVIDSKGRKLTYEYDENDNLRFFKDRAANSVPSHPPTATFYYGQDEFDTEGWDLNDDGIVVPDHILTTIENALGLPTLRVGFDSLGRVRKIQDASGQSADFAYETDSLPVSLPGHTLERISDAFGVPTEVLRDGRGNVVRRIQRVSDNNTSIETDDQYLVTVFEHNDVVPGAAIPDDMTFNSDNQTAAYQPFLVDEGAGGNRLEDPPPAGTPVVSTKYNDPSFDDLPTEVTDANGSITTYKYDDQGNLEFTTTGVGTSQEATSNNYYDGPNGELTRTVDAAGVETHFTYDLGRLETTFQFDVSNNAVNFSRFGYDDATNRLVYSEGPTGVGTYFVYDELGNQTLSYTHWTNPDDLTDIKTLITRTDYDEENRVVGTRQYTIFDIEERYYSQASELDSLQEDWSTQTNYDIVGRVDWTEDRFGSKSYNLYDVRGNVVETRTEAQGTNLWVVSRTFYDDNGRATITLDPFVVANNKAPGDEGFTTEKTATGDTYYWPDGTTLLTPEDYRATHTVYDDLGRVIETRRLKGSTAFITIAEGMFNEQPVPGIFTSTFGEEYDDGSWDRDTDVAVLSYSLTEYDDDGRVYRTVSPDKLETYFEYDSAGRQKAVIQGVDLNHDGNIEITFDSNNDPVTPFDLPDGGSELVRTVTEYDALGRQEFATDAKEGIKTKFEYDSSGRVAKTIADFGAGPDDLNITTQTEYNELGQRWREIDPLLQVTEFKYDHAGRLSEVLLPEITDNDGGNSMETLTGSTVGQSKYIYDYDSYGNQVAITDPNGQRTEFTYDHRNRQVSRTLPIGVDSTGNDYDFVERMFYDDTPYDLIIGLAESVGMGQLAYSVDFESRVAKYLYDNSKSGGGRLVKKIDYGAVPGLNLSTTSTQTELEVALAGLSAVRTVTYTYDTLGRTTEIADDAFGTTTTSHQYDIEGRLTQIDSPQGTINYEYDNLGRMDRTYTTPSSTSTDAITDTEYAYDRLGRLKTVTVVERNNDNGATNENPTTYYYDKNGNLDATKLPNDVIADYVYDDANRLKNLIHFTDAGTPDVEFDDGVDSLVSRFDYEVREDGKRTQEIESDDAGNPVRQIDYVYDELGRLVEEAHDAGTVGTADANDFIARYGYDLNGNRTLMQRDDGNNGSAAFDGNDASTSYQYDANDRLEHETTNDNNDPQDRHIVYGYDGTTQTTESVYYGTDATTQLREQTTMTYDSRGRVKTIRVREWDSIGGITSDVTNTYKYNDDGIRVSSHDSATGETTIYHVDPNNHTGYAQILEEGVDAGTQNGRLDAAEIDRSYALGHDVISQAEAAVSGQVYFFLYDGHGSTRALLDTVGGVVSGQQFAYDAYGNRLDTAIALTTLLYSGEQTDPTGMQYLRARYYDPAIGRFNRLDPFAGNSEDPQTLNKYLYGHSDPINGVDPSGLFTVTELVSNIGTMLRTSAQQLNAVYKAYRFVNRFQQMLEIFQFMEKSLIVASSLARATSRQGLGLALMQGIRSAFPGVEDINLGSFASNFSESFDYIARNIAWDRFMRRLRREIPGMVSRVLTDGQLQSTAISHASSGQRVHLVFDLPSAPAPSRLPTLRLPPIPVGNGSKVVFMSRGGRNRSGRLLGIGYQLVNRAPSKRLVQEIIRIDYQDFTNQQVGPRFNPHYHIAGRSDPHYYF